MSKPDGRSLKVLLHLILEKVYLCLSTLLLLMARKGLADTALKTANSGYQQDV